MVKTRRLKSLHLIFGEKGRGLTLENNQNPHGVAQPSKLTSHETIVMTHDDSIVARRLEGFHFQHAALIATGAS